MERWVRWWLVGVSGAAAFFRFHGLFANTFYADEALFATWARLIAVWRDPLLQTQVVDKPPLLFYLQALFYPLQGPVEWAARLPNLIASILCVPLLGVLAWQLYRDGRTAVLAATVLAFTPLAIKFSPTAFTDPLLTTLLYASLLVTIPSNTLRRGVTAGWAGLFFGLAVATKYQAFLFLPLVGGTAVLSHWRWPEWRRWLMGFLPILLILLLWDVMRTGTVSLWPAQISNYGGVRLIWSWELWPRLVAWWQLWRMAWGTAVMGIGFWVVALLIVISNQHSVFINTLFILFIINYLALHWLLAVPVWDRYLLPLMPLTAVIFSRGLTQIIETLAFGEWRFLSRLLALAPLFLILIPAFRARQGQPTADNGAAQIAELLVDAPYGTVLYDHWYSWQWRYHLFDKRVYVSWFPHPTALVENLTVFGRDGNTHYLVLPSGNIAAPIRRAVEMAGFTLKPVGSDDLNRMTLYAIVGEE